MILLVFKHEPFYIKYKPIKYTIHATHKRNMQDNEIFEIWII